MVTQLDLEKAEKELTEIREQKELESKFAKTKREKEIIMMEIAGLKKAEKSSKVKKILATVSKDTGKGLKLIWRGIVKSAKNIEASNKKLAQVKKQRQQGGVQTFSPEAQLFLPKIRTVKTRKRTKNRRVTTVTTRKKGGKTIRTITTRRVKRKPMRTMRQLKIPTTKETNIWDFD